MDRLIRLSVVLVALAALVFAGPAVASTVTVNTTADSNDASCMPSPGVCSLRDAILHSTADTVVLPASPTHYMASDITFEARALTIQGAGTSSTVIDAGHNGRVFDIILPASSPGIPITIANAEITGGTGRYGGGGAIRDDGANLTLLNVLVDKNSYNLGGAGDGNHGGGAIQTLDSGMLTLTNSTITNNTFTISVIGPSKYNGGGAILAGGPVVATGSHIDANHMMLTAGPNSPDSVGCCSGGGGMFLLAQVNNSISNSTVNNNTVTVTSGGCCYGGGGIYVGGSAGANSTTLTDTTVNSNKLDVTGPAATTPDGQHCCSGGGAIQTFGGLTMVGGAMNNNTANVTAGDCCQGGGAAALYAFRQANAISDATFSGNAVTVTGSGVDSGGGALLGEINPAMASPLSTRLTITGSLFDANQATLAGGATLSGGGGLHLSMDGANAVTNSTISGNTTSASGTDQGGGGLFVDKVAGQAQSLTLANATIAGNSAPSGSGGGILSSGLDVRSKNSIIALNHASASSECVGLGAASFTSLGYNLTDAPNTCSVSGAGDQVVPASSVGLGPVQDNGGPTGTRALLAGSPAINAGTPAGCTDFADGPLTTDQRGLPRPSGSHCDIGAFELQQTGPPGGGTGPPGTPTVIALTRNFSFALRSANGGDITATIAARDTGRFTARASFKTKGASKSFPFATRSANATIPGLVNLDLRPGRQARAALKRHGQLHVAVVITLLPHVGARLTKHGSITVREAKPEPAKHRGGRTIPANLDVTGHTTFGIGVDPVTHYLVFSGTLDYSRVTSVGGRRLPEKLVKLARRKCLDLFDAGATLGPYPHGPHPAVRVLEHDSPIAPGQLLRLTVGTTRFGGNGRWSRIAFYGDVGKTVIATVGTMDGFENYLGGADVVVKYKSQSTLAHCEGVTATRVYDGPQANHGH